MKIVVIIPTYNERDNIGHLITILEEEIFPEVKGHDMGILVADDNSPDKTSDEVRKLMSRWANIELTTGERRGLGAAYLRGMTYAVDKMGAEVLFEMDADLSHDPKKIPEFVKRINEGYDVVIGTRYSDGGSIPQDWSLDRKILSIFGNVLIRIILMRFSIHDWTGGFRAIRKGVFLKEKGELETFNGYTFQIAFLHKAIRDKFKVIEVPIHFSDRTAGHSKFVMKDHVFHILNYIIKAKIKELAAIVFAMNKKS